MISDPIKIDGMTYPGVHIVKITRSFSVLDGENTGRVMTGEMERDVIGTFYNYKFEVDSDDASPATYDALYEVLSAPEESHEVEVPYGQTTLVFDAYVTGGEDELQIMMPAANRWGGLSFSVIAMAPQRRAT